MTQIIGHQFAGGADPTAAGGPDGELFDRALPRPERFDIAGGADSRLTAGDQPGGARLLRREEFEIAGGASSSRPAGDDGRLASGNPGAVQPPPASRPDPVSIHISADTAALLALLAAERGGTLADAVAWLVVDDINRKGGIAHV